jgi:hypothetical protein
MHQYHQQNQQRQRQTQEELRADFCALPKECQEDILALMTRRLLARRTERTAAQPPPPDVDVIS